MQGDETNRPERPRWGLDFRLPGESRDHSYSPEKREEFPRLGEPEKPKQRPTGRINGAWGWIPLVTLALFSFSLGLTPSTPDVEGEDEARYLILGLIILGSLATPYMLGARAAFGGSRKGITWTLPATAVFLVIDLVGAFDEEAVVGGNRPAAAGIALAAAGLHVIAALLARPRDASQSDAPSSEGPYS